MGDHADPADRAVDQEIRFVLDGEIVRVRDVSPQTTLLEFLRERAGPHRHQGRLRRGRLRRLHRRAGRRERRRRPRYRPVNSCIRFLPTVDGKAVFTVESLAVRRRHAASGAAGDGRLPRVAMRLLHARLRDVAVRPVQERASPDASRHRRRAVGQPVPLHRLPADHRRGRAHERAAGARAGGARRASTAKAGASTSDEERALATTLASLGRDRTLAYEHAGQRLLRADDCRRTRRAAERSIRTRGSSPAPPTSACGSPSSIANWARSSTPATCASCSTMRDTEVAIGHRRRGHADRRIRGAERGISRAGRGVDALRLGADPQLGHARRQHRQRFADRRLDAGADRARRERGAAPRRARARAAARSVLPRLSEDGAGAGRVRRSRSASRARQQTSICARTRFPSASTRTSRRSSSAFACVAMATALRRCASAAAAWRRSPGARRSANGRLSANPGPKRRWPRGRLRSTPTSRRCPTCARRPTIGVLRCATSCGASTSRRERRGLPRA